MKLDILLPLKFNHPFTYESDLQTKLKKGDYVVVPFRNKKLMGIVWDCNPKVPSNIKPCPFGRSSRISKNACN